MATDREQQASAPTNPRRTSRTLGGILSALLVLTVLAGSAGVAYRRRHHLYDLLEALEYDPDARTGATTQAAYTQAPSSRQIADNRPGYSRTPSPTKAAHSQYQRNPSRAYSSDGLDGW